MNKFPRDSRRFHEGFQENPGHVCSFVVHKILNTGHTPYLTELLQYHKPQGPRVHLPVTYFLFRDITFHLVLALSASLRPKYRLKYHWKWQTDRHVDQQYRVGAREPIMIDIISIVVRLCSRIIINLVIVNQHASRQHRRIARRSSNVFIMWVCL